MQHTTNSLLRCQQQARCLRRATVRVACSIQCRHHVQAAQRHAGAAVPNEAPDATNSSNRQQAGASTSGSAVLAGAVVSSIGLALLMPGSACAGESLSGSGLDMFEGFLDQVTALGPWGPVLFVATVMLFEMIPLFPTQPLSLASGLLFGTKQGALLMLLGVTLAAFNAFTISRGVGRPLAEKVIQYEMGDEGGSGGVAKKLAEVQQTIESGSFWQQFIAIFLLRLTPVVPFSASNYVLGLTPVAVPAFVGGTLAGMAIWSVLYASLGGASRSLLDSGMDIGTLFADLAEQSGSLTKTVILSALGLAAVGSAIYGVQRMAAPPAGTDESAEVEETEHVHAKEEAKAHR